MLGLNGVELTDLVTRVERFAQRRRNAGNFVVSLVTRSDGSTRLKVIGAIDWYSDERARGLALARILEAHHGNGGVFPVYYVPIKIRGPAYVLDGDVTEIKIPRGIPKEYKVEESRR